MESENLVILYPNNIWYIKSVDNLIDFPPLHYYKVSQLNVPEKTLVLGGSHNIYAQFPMYLTRCEIFEQNFMPYTLNTIHFKVRNAALLWPRLNLYSYTDMVDPQNVYIKKNNTFVAKFVFSKTKIELYEITTLKK
ncbi:DiNV CH01M ORF64-like protein [Mauternbach virus]|uniref:DiNV CH01M ORF64-like protein n=1 Tax=Mauternbach virus TaxID=2486603 RepID=A0A3G3E8D2_9VIRU|nr:DiNV CH01M ORF64-like protein [Mauternbach virus]AYP97973.1 DiNV CH01M ORF64-like protein [Mauternbach virus]